MRRVADAAGLPVAGERCRPNAVVFVVADRKKAINQWRLNRPDFFAGLTLLQINALADGDGPVAAWQVVQVKGPDGRLVGKAAPGGTQLTRLESNHYEYLIVPGAEGSRQGRQIRIEFFGSFVLIEKSAIGNVSIGQLADYAAMRTFANTDPQAAVAQPLPTILSLFTQSAEAAPLSVTRWDLSYLKALYDTRLESRAADQQREMAHSIKRDAAKEE